VEFPESQKKICSLPASVKLVGRELTFLFIIAFSGVAVRLASFANFIKPEGGFYFYNPDSYDHLRHIMLGIQRFPSITLYDRYAGYPVGTGHIWAPLYDYIFTLVASCLGLGKPAIETLCFFSGPLLYAVSIFLLFFVMRRLFNSSPGALAAAVVFTFHPALISYSLPMNFDHHVLEPILCLLFISLPFLEDDNGFTPGRLLAGAFLFVAALFFWRGSTLFWGLSFGAVLLRSVMGNNRSLAAAYGKLFLLSSGMLALYCLFDPLGLRRGVSLVLISWFHPLILAGFAATLFAFAYIPLRIITRVLIPALIIGLILIPFTPLVTFIYKLKEAVQFMFGVGDPWLSSINELEGTFTTYGFLDGVTYLTVGYFIAPIAVILAIVRWKENRQENPLLLHFVAWYPLAFLAWVYRYALYSTVTTAMATACLASFLWLRLVGVRRLVGVILLVSATILPSLKLSVEAMHSAIGPNVRYGLFGPRGALDWIKNNTPATSHYLNPIIEPEYGILADWDLGSYIYYGAERPSLATPFGWETHGFFEHAAFFATTSPDKAIELTKANKIKYVLTTWRRSQKTYHDIALSGEAKGKIPTGTVSDKLSDVDSMYYRLFYQDGGGYLFPDGYRQALGTFRLVFESDYPGGMVPATGVTQSYYKLFEIVSGAIINGRTTPHNNVVISLKLSSGRGRLFGYQDTKKADDRGIYSFRVPYATTSRQGDTQPASNYLISISGEKQRELSVSEEQVINGKTIGL